MSRPVQIVAAIAGRTTDDLCAGRAASAAADILELRLDGVAGLDLARAIGGETRPVIATCRPERDGGPSTSSDAERLAVLRLALAAGARWVEVEWRSSVCDEALAAFGDRVVLSLHDFERVPEDLATTFSAIARTKAAVVKIAVTPRSLRETIALATLRASVPSGRDVVMIGMGPHGVATRIAPARFGSCWAYGGDEVAPGQYPVADLADVFRVRAQSASTAWYGLLGHPVGHSPGPWMHNAGFAAAGLDAVYLPLDAVDFDDAMACADWLPLAGASVTAPFKRDAVRIAHTHDAQTLQSGAANTLRRVAGGRWQASNFDVPGFLDSLRSHELSGGRALVLGAGGAARAVIVGAQARGMHVTVAARRSEASDALARDMHVDTTGWPPEVGDAALVVNSTPVGTWPDSEATPMRDALFGTAVVYDLVYNPEQTRFLRDAAAQGCVTIPGLDMLVAQAHEQFRQWTEREAVPGVFHRAARTLLERRRHAAQTASA